MFRENDVINRSIKKITDSSIADAFTNRNGPEWTSITGMDLKIHPKIHVLSVFDKKILVE